MYKIVTAFLISITLSLSALSASENVLATQKKLNALGFNAGTADGIWGISTKNALIEYLLTKGLKFDGVLDANEFKMLDINVLNSCKVEIFSDRLVTQNYVDRVSKAHQFACKFFGPLDAPLEIWIYTRDSDAYLELEEKWCKRRKNLDTSFIFCSQSQIGRGSNSNTWNKLRMSNYLFHQLNLKTHKLKNNNQSPEYVTVHEYFHAWQKTKIGVIKSYNKDLANVKLGKLKDGSRLWFNEGSAQYLSLALWYNHKKMPDRFESTMQKYFKESESHINSNLKVKSLRYLPWEKGGKQSYYISSWAMAYLISKVGLNGYLGIYDDLPSMSLEDAFEKNYGLKTIEFERDFTKFITTANRTERNKILLNEF